MIVLKGKESTVYVAARGEPYPVRLEFTYTALDTAFHSVLNFSEFGTVTAAIGPPTGDIVDRSSS